MFLVAITKDSIAQNFSSNNIYEFNIQSSRMTIITDKFLSKLIMEKNGFSVVESPLINHSDFGNIFFSRLKYEEFKKRITVFKSTISGRSIYYTINNQKEFFCSTHISMLRRAGVCINENTDVLPEFFIYRYVMPPNSLYKNIYHLFTGGKLVIDILDGKCKIHLISHYNPPEANQKIKSIKECSKKICDILYDSIDTLGPVRDEISLLLSGGKDSSITSKICKQKFGINMSYSSGYPFEDSNCNFEKDYAFSAAEALGMNHNYYEPSIQQYLNGFLEAITLSEEPLHHLQSVLFHLLFKNAIPKHNKYIIHGQGAGFCFGNVTPYLYWRDKIITKFFLKDSIKKIFFTITNMDWKINEFSKIKIFKEILREVNSILPYSNPNNPLWSWHDFGSVEWSCNYFDVTHEEIIKNRYEFILKIINKCIYDIWSLYSLIGDEDITLPIWHKLGEGNKKILYAPFYDSRVLDYVFSIPWKIKLGGPPNILRNEIASQCNIPKFIIIRPKMSFGIHPDRWGNKGGIFESLVPLAAKVINDKEIRKMQSTESKKAMTYWNMLNYAIWKRLCINNEPLEVLLDELGN